MAPPLIAKAPECGAFDRNAVRIKRIDPGEAVGFVELFIDVPVLLETTPGIAPAGKSEAAIIPALE